MADGYARASGKVGVAIATSGPGATNLVTGIATAMLDSIPMVCITGQVPAALIGSDAFQETDITGVTLPITKHNYLVTEPDQIVPAIREAFYVARTGRPGPVVVDIAKDAQQRTCHFHWPDEPVNLPAYTIEESVDLSALHAAASLISEAERPLILAGHGVIRADAAHLLAELVERTDIPAGFTLLGLGGLPEDHPRNLGMVGMHGEAWANEAMQRADLLIALGMRFDDRVTGKLSLFAPSAKVIHVDLDRAEINKNVAATVALVGDVADVLRRLTGVLEPQQRPAWNQQIETSRVEAAERDIQSVPHDGRLHAAHVVKALWDETQGEALVVADVGQNQMWTAQYYRQRAPRRFVTSGGLGTMGFALPAAIGARLARPDEQVWVIAGDGGFQMTSCDLSTCAQEKLDLNIAILNNGYLGMVRQWQELFHERRYVATPIGQPDFVKLAEAHGLTGLRVTHPDQVAAAIRRAQQTPGTVLIDFRVEWEDCVYPMVPAGSAADQMLRRPNAKRGSDSAGAAGKQA
jgi:acetolactate synthase-1/2/3 large subunit